MWPQEVNPLHLRRVVEGKDIAALQCLAELLLCSLCQLL